MRKASKDQIIKWYKDGLTVDEIAPIMPQYCKPEIESVIKEHRRMEEWARLTGTPRP